MPIAAPGSIQPSTWPSQIRRNAQTPTTSWTIRIGSRIAAARTGEIVIAIIGSDSAPTPANPPFASPSRITAIVATIQKVAVSHQRLTGARTPARSRRFSSAFRSTGSGAHRKPKLTVPCLVSTAWCSRCAWTIRFM